MIPIAASLRDHLLALPVSDKPHAQVHPRANAIVNSQEGSVLRFLMLLVSIWHKQGCVQLLRKKALAVRYAKRNRRLVSFNLAYERLFAQKRRNTRRSGYGDRRTFFFGDGPLLHSGREIDRPGEEAEITSAACKPLQSEKTPLLFIGIFLLQEWPVLPRDTHRNPQSVPGARRHHAVPAQ